MPSIALLSIFSFSLVHTLIPSHWLCFVVVGKAQGWTTRRTMLVAAAAGVLHVASTVTLGVLLKLLGRNIAPEEELEHISAWILIGLGSLYLLLHFLRAGHHHEHDRAVAGRVAFLALLFSLTLSPCSAAIPLLIPAAGSVGGIVVVTSVLLVTTVGTMLLLIGLTSLGIDKLRLTVFEHYEKLIVGLVLATLGTALLFLHHHHE